MSTTTIPNEVNGRRHYLLSISPRPRAHYVNLHRFYESDAQALADAQQLVEREYPAGRLLMVLDESGDDVAGRIVFKAKR